MLLTLAAGAGTNRLPGGSENQGTGENFEWDRHHLRIRPTKEPTTRNLLGLGRGFSSARNDLQHRCSVIAKHIVGALAILCLLPLGGAGAAIFAGMMAAWLRAKKICLLKMKWNFTPLLTIIYLALLASTPLVVSGADVTSCSDWKEQATRTRISCYNQNPKKDGWLPEEVKAFTKLTFLDLETNSISGTF